MRLIRIVVPALLLFVIPAGAALGVSDIDLDGWIDTADNCPATFNPDQIDTDADGSGDACDANDDNDSLNDPNDPCPKLADATDGCPDVTRSVTIAYSKSEKFHGEITSSSEDCNGGLVTVYRKYNHQTTVFGTDNSTSGDYVLDLNKKRGKFWASISASRVDRRRLQRRRVSDDQVPLGVRERPLRCRRSSCRLFRW